VIRKEDVEATVKKFLEKEFPEIAFDADELGVTGEISFLLFEILTGELDD
jgi:hypothetical protein